jgi:hypothetical protein
VSDHKQAIAFSLVIVGLLFTLVGCWYHLAELSTCAVGVVGGGVGMLKGSDSNSVKGDGSITVTPPDPKS